MSNTNGTADKETEWDQDRREGLRILNGIVAQHRVAPKEIELQNGIVLGTKPVSEIVLRSVVTRIAKPDVPTKEFGDADAPVTELWPESPEYREALQDCMVKRNHALAHACQVVGTECRSVPDGYFMPEDDGWIDLMRVAGVEMPNCDTSMDRYAAWLDLHAITGFFDLNKITQAVLMLSAILEEEVWEAIRFFRSDDLGDAPDGGASAEVDSPDGSGVRARGPGAGDQDGGTGHGGRGRDTVDPVAGDGTARTRDRDRVSPNKTDGKRPPKRSRRSGSKGASKTS
ncbi:MAG: hypothetical protein V3R71_01595 [Gemmatimonadales bacterium]